MANQPAVIVRFISDRQELIARTEARRRGLEQVSALERLDMYWLDVQLAGGEPATYTVEPAKDGSWALCHQYGPDSDEAERAARARFAGSAEEAKQAGWVAALVAGRYFADDFEVEMCPHCDRWFAAGTTHEHLAVGGRIVPHHFRLHRAQLAAGFRPSWAPAAAADEPSLEELGTLDAPRDLP
jgi:hypothetical protein